jgi:periplasmic divalent cation tolerance protein
MLGADWHGPETLESEQLLVLTTCANAADARELARSLVEARYAACVNVLEDVFSVYRWDENVEHAAEVLLLIKTTVDRYAALESAIRARTGYELPEIVAVRIDRGLPGYLQWVAAVTEP